MDTERFDDLLRSLSGGTSRRGLLAGLTGGLLATMPFVLGGTETKAKKKGKRKKSKKSKQPGSTSQTPTSDPTPTPTPPPPPPANPCAGQPELTNCGNGKQCSGGVCALNPQCVVGDCFGQPLACCSGVVCLTDCPLSSPGQACVSQADCVTDDSCVGFICQ